MGVVVWGEGAGGEVTQHIINDGGGALSIIERLIYIYHVRRRGPDSLPNSICRFCIIFKYWGDHGGCEFPSCRFVCLAGIIAWIQCTCTPNIMQGGGQPIKTDSSKVICKLFFEARPSVCCLFDTVSYDVEAIAYTMARFKQELWKCKLLSIHFFQNTLRSW